MTKTWRHAVSAVALVALAAAPAMAEDFHWQGKVAAGKSIEIKGINGGIEARAASGTEVVVTAVKLSVAPVAPPMFAPFSRHW